VINRRELLKLGLLSGAALAPPLRWLARPLAARAKGQVEPEVFSQSEKLAKFIQPLRMVGAAGGIPVAQKDTVNPGWWQPGVDHYTIDMAPFSDQLHPDLPNPTRLWGYGQGPASGFKHLGGVIAAKRGSPVQITFRNALPPTQIIPVDDTIMGVMGNQNNRSNVHLHGGFVPWVSDGGPMAWWDPDGHVGPSFVGNGVLRPGQTVPKGEAEYYYPNNQGARLMWYHDHSFGITRINAYAGVASAYVIYDDYELSLVTSNNLPGPLDPRTLYLVFQDKIFVSGNMAAKDPTWQTIMPGSRSGDLWYAHQYDADRWSVGAGLPTPDPSVIPEFFGDTILVNGTVFPYVEVEQRQYRFRMLNACNARFLNPRLVFAAGDSAPENTEPANSAGPGFTQIASEGGFLPAPVMVNGPSQPRLLLAPAERADLIVDFRDVPDGSVLILFSDAPAPYPMGDDINDYFYGHLVDPPVVTPMGRGPNTRTLLQFRVKARVGAADPLIDLPGTLTPTDPFLVEQTPGAPTPIPEGVPVRRLTLNEDFDAFGRLIQFLGTDRAPDSANPGAFGRAYLDQPTEVISAGASEVWEIVNLTADTHPIHFHLVNVQVLSRQQFDAAGYAGGAPSYTWPATAPEPNELGFKETVRMNPGEVTRVLMKFDLPTTPFTVPESPRTGGHEYVWHCHILEHEEHDMMRPLVVGGVSESDLPNKVFLPFTAKR
jgi:spore coat protein A